MRSGKRAVYKGNEYEFIVKDNETYKLIVREPTPAPADFELNEKGNYEKLVKRDEISSLYYLDQYAKYKGHTIPIWELKENQLLLAEGDSFIAEEVGFLPSELAWEKGLYKKWVLRSEIEDVWEKKTPLA